MPELPNVIVFLTDQQRWDTSGLHGCPLNLTPNYDRMAMQGTHLAKCFSAQPVCGPARACLQTGQYATETTVWRNGRSLRPDAITLAHHFREAGYRTGYIGKWHLAEKDPVPAEERGGYEYWLAANTPEFCSEPYDCVLFDNDEKPVRLPGYRVDATVDAGIRFIDANQSEPFFLFLSILEPQNQYDWHDYVPPDGYREQYTGGWMPPDLATLRGHAHRHLGGYFGAVKRIDEAFGRMLDALKSLGLAEETIVLYTSDHGCHFGTRIGDEKRTCHESSIRIPGALTGPGFVGGGRIDFLVSQVDLPATLLHAASLPVPKSMQGRSILPLRGGARRGAHERWRDDPHRRFIGRRNDPSTWPEEVFVQISESQVGRAVRTERWKYAVAAPDIAEWASAPSADRYIEAELYDLRCDPYELNNLIASPDHGKVREVMQNRLLSRMREAGESEPVIEPSGTRYIGPRMPTKPEDAYM